MMSRYASYRRWEDRDLLPSIRSSYYDPLYPKANSYTYHTESPRKITVTVDEDAKYRNLYRTEYIPRPPSPSLRVSELEYKVRAYKDEIERKDAVIRSLSSAPKVTTVETVETRPRVIVETEPKCTSRVYTGKYGDSLITHYERPVTTTYTERPYTTTYTTTERPVYTRTERTYTTERPLTNYYTTTERSYTTERPVTTAYTNYSSWPKRTYAWY